MTSNLESVISHQNQPLVSIIIPNYNKCVFIIETLQSILKQTYSNWETIVVDDDSTDNSVSIIKSIAISDSRIKFYLRNRLPKGGSVCRNIGLEKSTGDFIIFLDSDDLLQPFCLAQRIDFMFKHPQLDFAVFTTGTFYNTIGDSNSFWTSSKKNHLDKFLAHHLQWNIMSPIWERGFLMQLNGFDEQFPRLQDVELHTRALLQKGVNYKIAHNYSVDCYYRIDVERTHQSYAEALKQMQSGIIMFTSNFEKLVNTSRQKKALRGTLFSFFTQVNYYRAMKWITSDVCEGILKELNSYIYYSKIFNNFNRKIIQQYCFLYQKGAWKIKGFNFLFKKLFIL